MEAECSQSGFGWFAVPDPVEETVRFDDRAGFEGEEGEQGAPNWGLRRVDGPVVVQYVDRTEEPNRRHRDSRGAIQP